MPGEGLRCPPRNGFDAGAGGKARVVPPPAGRRCRRPGGRAAVDLCTGFAVRAGGGPAASRMASAKVSHGMAGRAGQPDSLQTDASAGCRGQRRRRCAAPLFISGCPESCRGWQRWWCCWLRWGLIYLFTHRARGGYAATIAGAPGTRGASWRGMARPGMARQGWAWQGMARRGRGEGDGFGRRPLIAWANRYISPLRCPAD